MSRNAFMKVPKGACGSRCESGSFIWHPVKNQWVPRHEYTRANRAKSVLVMPDIQDFKSPVDGTVITSRNQIRDHERRHDMIQVGNERVGTVGSRPYDKWEASKPGVIERELASRLSEAGY